MSYVWISPEAVAAAAGDLAEIGLSVGAAKAAAAAPTSQALAAGGDECSANIAALFGECGPERQALRTRVQSPASATTASTATARRRNASVDVGSDHRRRPVGHKDPRQRGRAARTLAPTAFRRRLRELHGAVLVRLARMHSHRRPAPPTRRRQPQPANRSPPVPIGCSFIRNSRRPGRIRGPRQPPNSR
ncbi:PE family protein [Mycobacterium simulans]|uniref:PE family protein n=1 Tax=Mycobacterium simulans TaxID=627089 RepID=UPI001748D6BA|nr:PE family protein [Mycobacterium simulans]